MVAVVNLTSEEGKQRVMQYSKEWIDKIELPQPVAQSAWFQDGDEETDPDKQTRLAQRKSMSIERESVLKIKSVHTLLSGYPVSSANHACQKSPRDSAERLECYLLHLK